MQSWLTKARKEKGINQKDLYTACGLSGPTWLKIEEDPTLLRAKDIISLAKLFNISPSDLMDQIYENTGDLKKDVSLTPLDKPEILDKVSSILIQNNLTWRKFAEQVQNKNASNLKRDLEGWIKKLNKVLNKIGYQTVFIKNNISKDN